MLCIHSWLIWQRIECFRWHETPGKSNVKWKHSFLDFGPTLGKGRLVENYINHCYSCLDSSALWTLNFTMYYALCNPKVDVILPNWRSESQGAIYPYEWCSWVKSIKSGEWRRKQTELDSILGQPVNVRLHISSPSQWTLNFMPGVYRSGIPMENQTPRIKEPQDLYLDSPLPKRIC